jgi:membrane protease YdiL (CAAX protease family)
MLGETEDLTPQVSSGIADSRSELGGATALAPLEIWVPRDLLMFLAFIPVALLTSKYLVLLGYVGICSVTSRHMQFDSVQSDTFFLLVQQCVFYVLILSLIYLQAKLIYGQAFWHSLGCKRLKAKQAVGYLAGGGGLAITASLALWLRPDLNDFPLEKFLGSGNIAIAIGGFAISIAPLVEELVFRGLLFAIIEGAMGARVAVVVTALLFAGLHIPEYWQAWHHLFMILIVGLVFSLTRAITGSVTPSIVLHVGYNSLLMLGLLFTTNLFHHLK